MDGRERHLGITWGLASLLGALAIGWPAGGAAEDTSPAEIVADAVAGGTLPGAVPSTAAPPAEIDDPADSMPDRRAGRSTATATAGSGEASGFQDAGEETSFARLPDRPPLAHLPEAACADSTAPDELTRLFRAAGPIVGADYQRAFPLPDGRVLWLFQDAFVSTAEGPVLVHNAGLVQSGKCVQPLVGGSGGRPTSYLFADAVDRFDRWFWPLGGELGNDGRLHVFVAEMRERGDRYLQNSEPTATWLVSIDVEDFSVHDPRPAPDASADLYGWSVVSHGRHTYLYAHCYRQFGWEPFPFADPPFLAHDWSCTAAVTVARIPRGELDAVPEYWNGSTWTAGSASAVPVIETEGRSVNPTQVGILNGRFIAVTKVGDWWGDAVVLDVAPSPEGPWRTYGEVTVEVECERCNTYFASFVPFGHGDHSVTIGLSRNTWDGDDLDHYSGRALRAGVAAAALPVAEPVGGPGAVRRDRLPRGRAAAGSGGSSARGGRPRPGAGGPAPGRGGPAVRRARPGAAIGRDRAL